MQDFFLVYSERALHAFFEVFSMASVFWGFPLLMQSGVFLMSSIKRAHQKK